MLSFGRAFEFARWTGVLAVEGLELEVVCWGDGDGECLKDVGVAEMVYGREWCIKRYCNV